MQRCKLKQVIKTAPFFVFYLHSVVSFYKQLLNESTFLKLYYLKIKICWAHVITKTFFTIFTFIHFIWQYLEEIFSLLSTVKLSCNVNLSLNLVLANSGLLEEFLDEPAVLSEKNTDESFFSCLWSCCYCRFISLHFLIKLR